MVVGFSDTSRCRKEKRELIKGGIKTEERGISIFFRQGESKDRIFKMVRMVRCEKRWED
jgi:hypothetical protein